MTNHDEFPQMTPWGEVEDFDFMAPGIVRIYTASHGGIWLSPERNAQVPMHLKHETFLKNGLQGWYEEDFDVEIVAKVFPDEVFLVECPSLPPGGFKKIEPPRN